MTNNNVESYDPDKGYPGGSQVEYNGRIYEAKWWADAGYIPGDTVKKEWETPWRQIGGDITDTTDTTKTTTPVTPQEPINVEVTYGATWGTNVTSSVQFHLSEDLSTMTMLLPQGTISEINGAWGADAELSQYSGMDRAVFQKKTGINYEVTTFGFNLVLGKGKTFENIQVNECLFNDITCVVTFKQQLPPGTTPDVSQVEAVDPFPKMVADDSGKLVKVTGWTSKGTTYKTYKRQTYTTPSGTKEYLVGGYFTDWGIYQGFAPNRLPINNINFIQVAFAAICGPGDASNWYSNESATGEAKPKINELCQGKPVGTMIILDHWAHYGKKDMNMPEWKTPYMELAYHVEGYERDYAFLGFGEPDDYPIHNVGGVELTQEGKLNYAYGIQNDLRCYNQVLNRGVRNDARKFNMFLSIGGWTLSDPFPAIADNPTYRRNFINSVADYLSINKHINGIDIDWEFIGVDGAKTGIMGPRDRDNYTKLMCELRAKLTKLTNKTGVTYHLSAAIGTAPYHLDKIHWNAVTIDGTRYPGIGDILDHVFLMSYDYYGPWGNRIGHQAALYTNGENAGFSANAAVQHLKSVGVPSRKIILGVTAYGRIWKNAQKSDLNHNGKYTFPNMATGQPPGSVGTTAAVVLWHHLKRVAYQDDGTTLKDDYRWIRDTQAKAEFLSYEDPESDVNFIASLDTPYSVNEKARYVKQQELGGIFYWTLDNDNGDLLNAIHEGLGSELKSPILKPSFKDNSMLLYRVKEANHCSNANVKGYYFMKKIASALQNFFTFGGVGIVEAFKSLLSLPAALANNTSIHDLTDEEWEEYVKLIKTVDNYGDTVADLTVEKAKAEAINAGATLRYEGVAILFSPPALMGLGLDLGAQDYIMDIISQPDGEDYCGRIIRDSLDPWDQMREDFPELDYNYKL
ncbi:MAG: hypothetical protein GKR94_16780 [Gammaproteobacteria bacterium]|nr:hypothetical protein [Gammaproteobacteria bacterium]